MKILCLCCCLLFVTVSANLYANEQAPTVNGSIEVMQGFNENAIEDAKAYAVADKKKHQILFFMGVALLILLCTTAYLGVSMVVFNKEVFVAHMVSAGLTVTLGLVHAVTAIVWFFPF